MTISPNKPAIFISYAHLDEPEKPREGEVQWLSFVTGHLRPAVKHGAVDIWIDRLMRGGDDVDPEIEHKLRVCDIFVLLVSRHSTSSDYVVHKEVAVIRERQARGEVVHFYPLLLTPTAKAGLDVVRDKNLRPRDAKPFSSYSLNDRDQHMAEAANEIAEIAAEIAARKSARAPAPDPTPSPPQPVVASTLPPNPRMIGRADRLDELVKAILEEDRPIVVPGALGMGKTTLTLAAAYDERVIARFGKGRRFFVNLEPAPDADGLLRRLAADLGLAASGTASEVEAKMAAACAAAPTLAILDNLETPWRKDTAATEALLGRLAATEGLRLILTIRGEPPHLPGPGALTLKDVEQLSEDNARALFLRHADDQFATDPAQPGLLRALDGHPLSIELLATNAQGKANLRRLAADWRDRRADLLEDGAADNRKTSFRASLAISLEALHTPNAAHRLVRLMALLPDGMSEADSRTILSDSAPTKEELGAALRLEGARLANHPDGRWRLLAPVRETLLADFPPENEDRGRLVKLFLARAALGRIAGTGGWGEVSGGLIADAGNLDAMIRESLQGPESPDGVLDAVKGLARFHRMTGLASTASLPAAAKRFHDAGDGLGEAICLESLGDVALDRSDQEEALGLYEAALPLYQNVGAVIGEANCTKRLGDIALARSDHTRARRRYEVALRLYQRVGDALGEANCIKSLGDVFDRSDNERARQRYEAALPLYQKVGDVLGEAHCIFCLGDIAFRWSDHEGARQRYESALPLYQKVGDVLGEANCIQRLGEIAFEQSDYEEARERHEAALPLYQKVRDPHGEANCVRRLGDIEEAATNIPAARKRWRAALALYTKIPDPKSIRTTYSIGTTHRSLARHAATPEEAAEHEAAGKAWQSIGRPKPIINISPRALDLAQR